MQVAQTSRQAGRSPADAPAVRPRLSISARSQLGTAGFRGCAAATSLPSSGAPSRSDMSDADSMHTAILCWVLLSN